MRVGLFGTCAKSTWREYFLKLNPKFTTFDPRVHFFIKRAVKPIHRFLAWRKD